MLIMFRPIALLLIVSGALSAQATPPAPAGAAPNAAAQGAPPPRPGPRPFAEVTRGAEMKPGFFDTYEKDDKVWLAVPSERLGKDFLMEMKLAQGIGANGLFGGTMLNLLDAREAPALVAPAQVASPDAGVRYQFTLAVDDVDDTCAALEARGVELLNGPVDRPWGIRTASFRDPGGHIWEIAR